MMKKRATKKNTGKKSAKKSATKKPKTETNPVEVHKQVSQIVKSQAAELTQAVVEEGMKGQVAPVRYLFEMANIFPAQTDPEHATEEEDCLAKILLSRMEAPPEPEKEDDDEPEDTETGKTSASAPAASGGEGEKQESGAPVGAGTLVT